MGSTQIIDRGRGPELADIRITVFDVIPYLEEGWSPSSIAYWLGITVDQVKALIRYIEEHREEVMAENRKIVERIARGNPPEIEEKVKASHAKLLALKAERERRQPEGGNGEGDPR